jgi:hypothetical protein
MESVERAACCEGDWTMYVFIGRCREWWEKPLLKRRGEEGESSERGDDKQVVFKQPMGIGIIEISLDDLFDLSSAGREIAHPRRRDV